MFSGKSLSLWDAKSALRRTDSWCQRLQPLFRQGCSNLKNVFLQTICLFFPRSVLKSSFNRISTPPKSLIVHTRLGWYISIICICYLFLSHGYFSPCFCCVFDVISGLKANYGIFHINWHLYCSHTKNYSAYQIYKGNAYHNSCPQRSWLANLPFSFTPR